METALSAAAGLQASRSQGDSAAATATAASLLPVLLGLAGCAAGSDADAPPAQFFDLASAQTGPNRLHVLAAAGDRATTLRLPSPTTLMDWAERVFPQFFPGHSPDTALAPYVFRYYPATRNYVGVADSDVYILGPVSGDALQKVGTLADFACLVDPGGCRIGPASDRDAARFLQQAQFSASEAEIAAVRAQGYAGWLNTQFDLPMSQTAWDWLVERGYTHVDASQHYWNSAIPFNFAVHKQLWSAPDAVRKRCALALSEVFVIGALGLNEIWPCMLLAHFWDMLNRNAFGNYRTLLEDVTLSAAMGVFLNTRGNQKENLATGRRPDENYAREVMQLFSIGLAQLNLDGSVQRNAAGQPIETYSAADVSNLARVFTGYDLDQRAGYVTNDGVTVWNPEAARLPMKQVPTSHSTQAASFLGTTVAANTDQAQALKTALDTLFKHPNVGPFLGRQMIQRLVTSNPSPAYVARVAAAFNDNGQGVRGDLKALFSAVLLDDEARGPAGLASTTHGKLREPMLRFLQWGRTFKLTSLQGSWKYAINLSPESTLGQYPFWSPSVFNFFRPGFVPPGTALATTGATAPEFQIVSESSVSTYVNFIKGICQGELYVNRPEIPGDEFLDYQPTLDLVADYSAELALVLDPPALVARLNLLLCAGQLSADTEQLIADALATWPLQAGSPLSWRRDRVAQAVLFVMTAPDYLVQK